MKSSGQMFSLCILCVLCASVVKDHYGRDHRRDAEIAEEAQSFNSATVRNGLQ